VLKAIYRQIHEEETKEYASKIRKLHRASSDGKSVVPMSVNLGIILVEI